MKTVELMSGITVMVPRRAYELLEKIKKSKKDKIRRADLSERVQVIADTLVSHHLLNRDDEYYYVLPFYEIRNNHMELTESKRRSLKIINETLQREHDFTVTLDETISVETLKKIKQDTLAEQRELSYGKSPQTDPHYSQCALILEAVDLLLGEKTNSTSFSAERTEKTIFEQIDELEEICARLKENAGGPKKGDIVDYLGNKAKVVNVDGGDAWIKVEGQGGTMAVNTSDLKPLQDPNGPKVGDVVQYMDKKAKVLSIDGDVVHIAVEGEKGSMAAQVDQLKPLNESKSVAVKLKMLESKIVELRNRAYTESKEEEIRLMLKEDAQRAEVIMAAKGLLDTVQGFQTKIGDLMNKNLDPFIERVRSVYGSKTADSVYQKLDSSLAELMTHVKTSKDSFFNVVGELSGEGSVDDEDLSADDDEVLPSLEDDDFDLGGEEEPSDEGDVDLDDLDLDLSSIEDDEESFTRKDEE